MAWLLISAFLFVILQAVKARISRAEGMRFPFVSVERRQCRVLRTLP